MPSVGSTRSTRGGGSSSAPPRRLRTELEAVRLDFEREANLLELRRLRALNQRLTEELGESLHELRASRARISSAAVQERRRIERDLHDGAQQRLIAAQMRVGLARELLAGGPRRGRELLARVSVDLQAALADLRALAHGLYPAALSDNGVAAALREAARHSPLRVTVDPGGAARYSAEIESAVYFCCLESLQNAAKHARGATSASITLAAGDDLTFEVTDDGSGFDPATTPAGAGLTNMRDRLATVNGALELRSSPARGTSVLGTIPLQTRG